MLPRPEWCIRSTRQSTCPPEPIVFAASASSIRRTPALSLIELARLSAGQTELLTDTHRRWEGVRMSTARADRSAAESGIVKAYRGAALAPPERVVWCNGPLDVARSA